MELFRKYYRIHEWINLQLDPRCAVYDPELTYTLRPGEFRFAAREFDNAYVANRLGLRDDDSSLVRPEIIVLGDSHALGWGVEQDQTFSSLLEQSTGRKVLNAGIPSFGTVRELKLLERLDTSALKTLVIQYCSNDLRENQTWRKEGGQLSISSPWRYKNLSVGHLTSHEYFFGRHVYGLAKLLWPGRDQGSGGLMAQPTRKHRPADEARLFMKVVAASPIDLSEVDVVVLELNANCGNDRAFLDKLDKAAQAAGATPPWRQLKTVDVSTVLRNEHYWILDSHMQPAGHALVAELLIDALSD